MSLIKCPECGKEVSDKSRICVNCGYPIEDYMMEIAEREEEKKKYICNSCGNQNEIGDDYCVNCGMRLTPYTERKMLPPQRYHEEEEEEFRGIYRATIFGMKEVYCPRCGSEDCSHYKEQKVIPAKTKTRYTANLNPLHPFTLVNKKEKVKRKEQTYTENKFICNRCGKIFY